MLNETESRSLVLSYIQTKGLTETARRLDIHPEVLARVACGARVRAGTIALVSQRLSLLTEASRPVAISTVPPAGDLPLV